jgi:hypothetical protein
VPGAAEEGDKFGWALADQVDEGAAVSEVLAVAAELRQFGDRGAW